MKRLQPIEGQRRLEIICADTAFFLNSLANEGVEIVNATYVRELTLQLTVADKDYKTLLKMAEKQGASVKMLRNIGIYWSIYTLKKRPILLAFAVFLLLLFCYLPTCVLFVKVEGNVSIPTNQIVEAAAECGIGFGAFRRQIRSEKMKNALLQKMPQLQWAGINTSGCTAVITVKEKSEPEQQPDSRNQVCSIVAARDGIILNCTVFRGNPLCSVGQAVKAGQMLVSGYLDCGNYVQATQANAEIRAITSRELEVITPDPTYTRGKLIDTKTEYSVRIGKKLIKLKKDSGILGATCAKIYSEEYGHLPGDFHLPVMLIKETTYVYENEPCTVTAPNDNSWLYDFAKSHLRSTMIAGQIVSGQEEMNVLNGATYLYGKYACTEIIGQVKYEQTILKDEPND